jgi:hypothetical protein
MKAHSSAPERIRAHVLLKGRSGNLTSASEVSSRNVQDYVSDARVRERAREALVRLGFSVCRLSALSITVEAAPEVFETVFRGALKRVQAPTQRPGKEEGAASTRAAWTWSRPPEIPDELRDLIDTVVFPQPTRLLG